MFHQKCGDHVRLSNRNRTATRTASEFNFGLVFSSVPVTDEQLFQIRIDKKIESWIGSLEIGITTCDPQTLTFPSSATDLRNGTWVLSGKSILKDGRTLLEVYPLNLDRIIEGELIGVMRTSGGELEFYVNGVSKGVAADNIPERVFAVVNVYGKVSQVTVVPPKNLAMECGGEGSETSQSSTTNLIPNLETDVSVVSSGRRDSCGMGGDMPQQERLRFHERTGNLVKLSCNGRAAERLRPLDEFNNAVVMSKKPLVSDTLFEIRIDRLVEKWSGSIEVGVTTHDPAIVDFPATMTNMRSGTIMMSGCGILTNGKGTNREYGEFNLDRLTVGDRIGMMRKSNGDLHYFINGLDQGVAASRVPQVVWAVVDLYGMTVKVTIVDRDEREEQNLITRRNTVLGENILNSTNDTSEDEVDDSLVFHPNCGSHAAVINNGRTAHRPNALDDFNNAVVLTNRPLKINEVFEVRIDKMVTKWAGSIEIGVTTHSPTDLEYPSTMTNVRSGTWIMTGNGVMHNGTSVIDDYGQNLDKLQAGDRVGVVIRRSGSLHFLVNGEDQGEAGTGLPPKLHAVIDLYGQATQATIVSHCPSCSPVSPTLIRSLPGMVGSTCSLDGNQSSQQQISNSEIHFHSVHGRNARLTNGGRTASRPRAMVDFNDAVVITNRPLRRGEMFSVIVEKIVDRWSGSIEAGVTAIRPDDLELPGTMTDLDHDTWMLSGFAVMKDGVMVTHGYPLDLDKTKTGNVISLRRHDDTSLHFYLDGVDQGEACRGLPSQVYPVIDLYGQCAQVSIVTNAESLAETEDSVMSSSCAPQVEHVEPESSRIGDQSESTVLPTQLYLHKWHEVCGKGIKVDETGRASRSSDIPSGGLLFSSQPLTDSEIFEICLMGYTKHWAGSLLLGVTTYSPSTTEPSPPSSITSIREPTRFLQGGALMQNDEVLKPYYCQSLDWLRPGNRLGVKRCHDSSLHFYIDGVDIGTAVYNLPKRVYVVVELFGSTTAVAIVSKGESTMSQARGDAPLALPDIESAYERATEEDAEESKRNEDLDKSIEDGELLSEIHDLEMIPQQFHECHGRNVQLSESRLAAKRVSSYNQGLVLGTRPLARGAIFQVRIESLNTRWVSSLSIGVTVESLLSSSLPVTALGLKKNTWVVSGDSVFHNGHKVKTRYSVNLDLLPVGHTAGITIDEENNLRVLVNGVERGIAAANLPSVACLPFVDLYGMCDQVCIVPEGVDSFPASPSVEEHVWSETREKAELEVGEKVASIATVATNSAIKGGCMISSQQQNALRTKSDKMNENIQCSSLTSSTTNACTTPTTTGTAMLATAQQSLSVSATSLSLLHLHRKRSNSLQENVYKSPSQAVPRSVGGSLAVTPISPMDVRTPPCDYLMACLRLKSWLGLPNGYFRKENRCTCNSCCVSDTRQTNISATTCVPSGLSAPSLVRAPLVGGQHSDKSVEGRGDSVSNGIDGFVGGGGGGAGWAVLPLRKRSQNEGGQQQQQTGDSWHLAYARVDLGSVRRVLDTGRLLTQGEMNVIPSGGRKISDRKLDDTDNSQLVISPSLSAATDRSSYKYQYIDPKTKESYLAYAAFELLIRPGSYKVATQTEWVTKESSATSLVALLLRLEANN
uniref:Putative notch signaling protein n=1 Tax=Panstrongylus megistus TaxID=65343 RepID=A0A069DZT6_9HEMI